MTKKECASWHNTTCSILREWFRWADVNHDKFLDFNETLKEVLYTFGGHDRFELRDMDEHFENMDYNHDGLVSLSEYTKIHLKYRHMYNILVYRDIDTYIKIIDSNADGQMSYKEMENGLRSLRNHCAIQLDHQLGKKNCQ